MVAVIFAWAADMAAQFAQLGAFIADSNDRGAAVLSCSHCGSAPASGSHCLGCGDPWPVWRLVPAAGAWRGDNEPRGDRSPNFAAVMDRVERGRSERRRRLDVALAEAAKLPTLGPSNTVDTVVPAGLRASFWLGEEGTPRDIDELPEGVPFWFSTPFIPVPNDAVFAWVDRRINDAELLRRTEVEFRRLVGPSVPVGDLVRRRRPAWWVFLFGEGRRD